MKAALCAEKPAFNPSDCHSDNKSVGITIDIFPFAASSSFDFLKNFSGESVSLWRARVFLSLLHLRLFVKNGGLLAIASKG